MIINRRALLLGSAATIVAPMPSPTEVFAKGGMVRGTASILVDGKPLVPVLMGEHGPEAILPLHRSGDGKLTIPRGSRYL